MGAMLNKKLLWKMQVDETRKKAARLFKTLRSMAMKIWDCSLKIMKWVNTGTIRPMIIYEAIIRVDRATQHGAIKALTRIYRLECICMYGAI